MIIVYHEKAEDELIEAACHYEDNAYGLGMIFLEDVENALCQIQEFPEAAEIIQGEIRGKSLRRFPFRILYVAEAEKIRVLAIAHHKRRPGYWSSRK